MSQYRNLIESSVKNLLNVFDKLESHDRKFAISQLTRLINHANRIEALYKRDTAKSKFVDAEKYDDTLDYLIDVVGLMGFTEIEANYYFRDDFVNWFKMHALAHPKYQAKNITTAILQAFGESFRVFKMENNREPKDYLELRNYLLNFNELMTKLNKKQIDTLDKMDEYMQSKKQ